jgi:hypothetical protein
MVGVCSRSWPSPHMAFDQWSCPLSEVLHAQQSRRSRTSPNRLKATTIARTCLAGSGCRLLGVPSGTPPMPVAIMETRLRNDHTRAMNLCSAHNPPLPPVFLLRRLEKTDKRNEIVHATFNEVFCRGWGSITPSTTFNMYYTRSPSGGFPATGGLLLSQ